MYLNQFTNTKELWYAHVPVHDKNAYSGYMLLVCALWGRCVREEGGKNTFNIFFLLQNDTIYIIPYSFSQQNEFYKVLLYKKMSQFHKKLFFLPRP